jgi:chromosome segregation ATPase
LTAHLAALTERRAELTLPESLVRFDEVPLDLGGRLGTHGKTLIELPRLRGEIEQEEEEARAALRRAGRDVAREGAANFRIDPALQATVHKLVLEDAKWHEGKAHTERRLAEHRARLSALTATRAALAAARDATTLKKAILRAERDGALEERLLRARAEKARVEERARAELGGLGLADRSLTDVTSMAIPALETVERFAEQLAKLEEEGRQTAERVNSAETRRGSLTRDIDALERGGHVPSEQDLARARERRDAMWQALRAREAALDASAVAPFEAGVRAADDLADRLRREAERVNRLAALEADRDACSRELAACNERAAEVATRVANANDAWRALWQPLRIVPHPPREMKSWLLRHQAFVESCEALRETDSAAAELEGTIENHRQRLTALLDELALALPSLSSGEPAARPARLAELVDRAGEVAAAVENAAFERRQLDREITEQNEQLAALSARDEEHDAAKALLAQAWLAAVEPLGLRQDASPEQATATIELLEKAAHHRDRADLARRRAAALEREAAAFSADVERLAGEHAPDLAGGPADRVAAELVDRYHRGRSALAARRELDRQLEDTAHQLELQRERHAAALVKIDEMKRAAGVDSLVALERAERASDELRGLEQSIVRCDEELDPLGGAAALLAEAGDTDIDAVTVRLSDVDVEIEQLRERASMLDRRIGSAEAGLKDLEDPKAKAAEAAADAESALARVRDLATRYLRTRTACIVLAQEIESYRQKNQGPIMTRASELFRKLTLGSFAGLRTDFDEDDKPVLRGVRMSGDEIGVEGMSEGTRDQLYLALRVATLERYAEHGNPMPLVLDDILVHFDDDRARAALELLGELAGRLQILFFTHHARIVDLARETIRGGKLSVRELPEPESRNGSVGALPEALLGSARK